MRSLRGLPHRNRVLAVASAALVLPKAIVCVAKCHQARAAGKIGDEVGEDNCEANVSNPASCKSKFNSARDRLLSGGGCPTCLDQVAMDQVFAQGEAFLNTNVNSQVYCAQ